MSAKHRRKGILTGLGKPGRTHKPRKTSTLRTILQWIGGAAIVLVFGVMIAALGIRMFVPEVGERTDEGDYAILEIRDDPSAAPPETRAVAVALIRVRGLTAFVPLTAERRDTVAVGDTIHVRYTAFPNLSLIRVDEWEKAATK